MRKSQKEAWMDRAEKKKKPGCIRQNLKQVSRTAICMQELNFALFKL